MFFSRRWLVTSRPVDDRLEFPRWVSRGFSRDLAMVIPDFQPPPHNSSILIPFLLLQCSLVPARGARVAAFGRSAINDDARTIDNVWHVLGVGSVWLLVASESSERKGRCVDQVRTLLVSVEQHAASSDNRLAGWFPISLDARFQLLDRSASALSFNLSADLDVVYDQVRQCGPFLTHRNLLSSSYSSPSPQRLPS